MLVQTVCQRFKEVMCDKNSKTSERKRITGPGPRVTSLRVEKSYRTPPVFGNLEEEKKNKKLLPLAWHLLKQDQGK
jgi:hypothetical protein